MLWRTSKLTDYRIEATDGTIGRIADLLIKDDSWKVRWLAVDTGGWLTGHQVLLPTACLHTPDPADGRIPVDLTRQQVKDSPKAETDQPVSRQMEEALFSHYGWDPYWAGMPELTMAPGLAVPPVDESDAEAIDPKDLPGDRHLQSVQHLAGYHINATDDSIGHIEEFLVDDDGWTVRYLIVDTSNWWPGKRVLVSPGWIKAIHWPDRSVDVSVTKKQVEDSPEFDPEKEVDRPYEELLHRHYQKPVHWI